jgi:hypothetical protein
MDIKMIKDLDYGIYQDRVLRFLQDNDQYTIFHDPRFLSYHKTSMKPIENYTFLDIFIESSGNILAYLPGGIDTASNTYISHKGASFAGPVFSKHLKIDEKIKIMKYILDCLMTEGIECCHIKLTPDFYYNSQELQWVLHELGFNGKDKDATVYLPLHDDVSLASFSSSTRRNIKKGQQSSYHIQKNTDLEIFYKILLSNREKFSTPPTHSYKNLEYIQKKCPDAFTFFILFSENIPVAGMGMFHIANDVINLFYPCHLREYSYLKPNNVLLFEIINWAKDNQFKGIDFGPSNSGNILNIDLIKYKLGYGGDLQLRYSYYKRLSE